jgi:hypothetical protein
MSKDLRHRRRQNLIAKHADLSAVMQGVGGLGPKRYFKKIKLGNCLRDYFNGMSRFFQTGTDILSKAD